MPTRLFRTTAGAVIEQDGLYHLAATADWDALVNADDIGEAVSGAIGRAETVAAGAVADDRLLAPLGAQEVWAAGVTYHRSRTARMEESRVAGGGSFYDRVYDAERPELFFKATPHRVVGPGPRRGFASDSRWSVPEPELALVVNRRGTIVGCTIGNDMSARDIEGREPAVPAAGESVRRVLRAGTLHPAGAWRPFAGDGYSARDTARRPRVFAGRPTSGC